MKPLHKRLHVTISSLRGARNPHLLRVNSGFCAPCALNLSRSAVCAKVSIIICYGINHDITHYCLTHLSD